MKIDRSVSTKTWKEIDGLLWQIEEKALKAEDWETQKMLTVSSVFPVFPVNGYFLATR
jgi:hypothetical protein